MSSICQASPCTPLTNATGDTKYYKPGEGWFQQVVSTQNGTREEKLTYCPFCGTHLLEVTAPSIVRRVDRSAPTYVPASKYLKPLPVKQPAPKPVLRIIQPAQPKPTQLAAELTSIPAAPIRLLPPPPPPPKPAAPVVTPVKVATKLPLPPPPPPVPRPTITAPAPAPSPPRAKLPPPPPPPIRSVAAERPRLPLPPPPPPPINRPVQ